MKAVGWSGMEERRSMATSDPFSPNGPCRPPAGFGSDSGTALYTVRQQPVPGEDEAQWSTILSVRPSASVAAI